MTNLLSELKRRNVFKVGVAYAIMAWLLIQVTDIVAPALNLPEWTLTFIIYLLIIGFPLALFMAWAFELTPEGIKPTREVETIESISRDTGQKLNYTIIALLSLAVLLLVVDNYVLEEDMSLTAEVSNGQTMETTSVKIGSEVLERPDEPASTAPANSIAVLPFVNLSGDPEQEYFTDGLAEELLNKLAQVKDLQVTGRTSSFYFKGKNIDLREIGKILGVTYLLEGSVRKSGDQLRITAQLNDAAGGYHLWSDSYDRSLENIFAIQDEIAKAVTAALSVTLGAGEFNIPGMTRNVKAFDEYLKGMDDYRINSTDSIIPAITHAERAVQLDPNFGLGWMLLRNTYLRGNFLLPTEQKAGFLDKADAALQRAREVAPAMWALRLASAENADYADRERVWLQLVDELGRTHSGIHADYGQFLTRVGRTVEALSYLRHAHRLDPLNIAISIRLSMALLNLDRIDEALAEAARIKALGRTYRNVIVVEYLAAFENGDKPRAAEIIKSYYRLDGESPDATMLKLADILLMEDTNAALTELHSISNDPSLSNVNRMAVIHVATALGLTEAAIDFLNATEGALDFAALWHPSWRAMRALPGFKAFVRDFGLVGYWRATGNWGDFCRPVGEEDFECE